MAAVEREMQVPTFVEEVWNARNYAAAAVLYGETYVNPFGSGPAARVEPIRRYHEAFPDLHIDIEELIVAGDTVVLRTTFPGTDTGGYAGRAPTGRAVHEWVVTIMHFEADGVVREWVGADKLGLFIQLGVLEDPGPDRGSFTTRAWQGSSCRLRWRWVQVDEDGRLAGSPGRFMARACVLAAGRRLRPYSREGPGNPFVQ